MSKRQVRQLKIELAATRIALRKIAEIRINPPLVLTERAEEICKQAQLRAEKKYKHTWGRWYRKEDSDG